jgi:predicted acyltransferase
MFTPWLPPTLGSHTYALAIVLLNMALLYPLYHRRIFLRL